MTWTDDVKLDPGTVVERYVVEELLGAGGTAMVYLVRHRSLGTRHALKVLTLNSSAIRDRMLREGQVQAALNHPNVVQVTDVIDIDGQPGLLMEHVVGPSLERALNKYKLTMGDAEVLFQGILAGVRAAHDMGLVHRDLKPANVLLQRTQAGFVPKVTDFGLAKLLEVDPEVAHTRSGIAMGTPSYMAPEQVRDARSVDQRADLWSMGCLLYELMTRRRTFPGDEALAIYNAVTVGDFQPPGELVDALPLRVEQAIHGCLTVDCDARIPDCATLSAVLAGDKQWPLPTGWARRETAEVPRGAPLASDVPAMAVASEAGGMAAGPSVRPGGGPSRGLEEVTSIPRMPPPIDPGAPDEAETVLVSRSMIDGTLFPTEQSLTGDSHSDDDVEPEGRVWLYLSVALAGIAAVVLLLFAFGAVVGSVYLNERASLPAPVVTPVGPSPKPSSKPTPKPVVVAPSASPTTPKPSSPAPVTPKPASPAPVVPTPPPPAPVKPTPMPAAPAPAPATPMPAPGVAPEPEDDPVTSRVKFFSFPGGADLWVGGYRRGRTPTPLDLEPGFYEVQMQQHGGTPHNFRVEVSTGKDAVWCYVFSSSSVMAGNCPVPAESGFAP